MIQKHILLTSSHILLQNVIRQVTLQKENPQGIMMSMEIEMRCLRLPVLLKAGGLAGHSNQTTIDQSLTTLWDLIPLLLVDAHTEITTSRMHN